MKLYKTLVKKFLAEYVDKLRKRRNLTQENMAENLRITSRAYGDLERGKYCFSTIPLLFLLLMMTEEEVKEFLEEFRTKSHEFEQKEAA